MADPVLERLAADMTAEPLRLIAEEGKRTRGLNHLAIEALLVANGYPTWHLARELANCLGTWVTPGILRYAIYDFGYRKASPEKLTRGLLCREAIAGLLGRLAGFTYKEIWGISNPLAGDR